MVPAGHHHHRGGRVVTQNQFTAVARHRDVAEVRNIGVRQPHDRIDPPGDFAHAAAENHRPPRRRHPGGGNVPADKRRGLLGRMTKRGFDHDATFGLPNQIGMHSAAAPHATITIGSAPSLGYHP